MNDAIKNWSTLLEKYLAGEITTEELAELQLQMEASPVKRKQFEEVTTPGYSIKTLKEYIEGDVNANWKKLAQKMGFQGKNNME